MQAISTLGTKRSDYRAPTAANFVISSAISRSTEQARFAAPTSAEIPQTTPDA